MTRPVVRVDDATFGYDDRRPVLRHVDLEIHPGDLLGVVGPSGSGKTSLLRLLLGTVRPQRGAVRRSPGCRVGYVPQLETVNWNFPLTVRECVLMAGTQGAWVPWPSRGERAEAVAVLERLGIADLARRHIRDLSGGQQQRMFLARALLRRPGLLLLDEPTSGVDVAARHEVLHLLQDISADGIAVVLTTHDLNGMAAHLPRLLCLAGEVVAIGSPQEVIRPEVLERTFGARMEVLEHLGMPVVVETGEPRQAAS